METSLGIRSPREPVFKSGVALQNRKYDSRIESLRRELENNEKKSNACIEHNLNLLKLYLYALLKTHFFFIYTFAYTQIREHTHIFQHKHANTQYTLPQIPNHSHIRNIIIEILEYTNTLARLHEQPNTRIYEHTSTAIQHYTNASVQRCCNTT